MRGERLPILRFKWDSALKTLKIFSLWLDVSGVYIELQINNTLTIASPPPGLYLNIISTDTAFGANSYTQKMVPLNFRILKTSIAPTQPSVDFGVGSFTGQGFVPYDNTITTNTTTSSLTMGFSGVNFIISSTKGMNLFMASSGFRQTGDPGITTGMILANSNFNPKLQQTIFASNVYVYTATPQPAACLAFGRATNTAGFFSANSDNVRWNFTTFNSVTLASELGDPALQCHG